MCNFIILYEFNQQWDIINVILAVPAVPQGQSPYRWLET